MQCVTGVYAHFCVCHVLHVSRYIVVVMEMAQHLPPLVHVYYNTVHALSHVCAGLDAATSKDILTVLNRLTQTGCSVLLTIHQPRIEIFHMFHKIVLFTEGQVAYFGSPFKAISYFTEKLQERGMHFKVRVCMYVCIYHVTMATHAGVVGRE